MKRVLLAVLAALALAACAGDGRLPEARQAIAEGRLEEGLALLRKDSEANPADPRAPGLGEFPVLGRLFSSQSKDTGRSEIVLLVTPRIVRSLERPAARITEFHSGTETSLGAGGGAALSPAFVAPPPRVAPPQIVPPAQIVPMQPQLVPAPGVPVIPGILDAPPKPPGG